MQRFNYKAYDATGSLAAGEIAAASREAALEALARQGHIPFEVSEGGGAALPWWRREVFSFSGNGLDAEGLALFTRELATMVKAELGLDDALRIVALQPLVGSRIKAIAGRLEARVREGASLSQALAGEDGAFPEVYARLVRAGEASGSLPEALEDLASFLERGSEARNRIVSALAYPALLIAAALAAVVLIMAVLLPSVMPLFRDAGAAPPAILALLAGIADGVSAHWLLALVLLAAFTAGIVAAFRNAAMRLRIDRAVLRLPLAGGVIEGIETARFARTLATLIRNGVPLLDAMRLTSSVVTNTAMRAAVDDATREIKEGGTVTGPLARTGRFPDLALRLIAVGEETSQLAPMLMRVAGIYETTVERRMARIASLLTPILTIVIGVVVGGLILSVMNAIIAVNDLAIR